MSVRTGMYHFEVSRTAMYRVRYVLVRTSTYRHVLPCTRCTGFQMDVLDPQSDCLIDILFGLPSLNMDHLGDNKTAMGPPRAALGRPLEGCP
jgi:hypothetical protein